ncbi:MAG: sodium:solute symporter family protein [Planctomycetes bacterium]|nr:sodium:solute symporter family protein [Planctomycetota bacterium]
MTQLGIIVAYLALLLVLGVVASRLSRGTSRDYMLASHSIGPVLLLMSLFGTTMTAFALVGSTGQAFRAGVGVYGMLASASGIIHSACFFLIGVKLWAIGRRCGHMTQIQFFRDRLQSDAVGLLLFPILVLLVVSYLLLGVVASGAVVSSVTAGAFESQGWFAGYDHGVPPQVASAVVCIVVMIYVFLGGMRGTAWANAFQTCVFMVLGVLTFVTIANGLGGTDSFFENLKIATSGVSEAKLSMPKSGPAIFFSFLLIPLSVAMFPHVFQHWLTARSAKAFRLPIVVHPIFIMIVWLPCVLIGVWASSPAAGLAADIPLNDVLAAMVQQFAGPVLAGLLTAGILAAIMSSLDSQFLCLGTMFTEDIVAHYGFKDRLDDRRTIQLARLFVVSMVVLTYVLSLLLPGAVFHLGLWSFSGFTGLFPLVFAAIYWRRLTAAGAMASIVVTVCSWLTLFARSRWGENKRYGFPEEALSESIGIPTMLPVVTIFVASSVALIVVSLLTRPPSEETLERYFPGKS